MSRPSLDTVRRRFPALAGDTVFLENAGGSQVPAEVAEAVHRYFLESYVQLGAGYPIADRATRTVEEAHALVATLMNAAAIGTVALGASTSILCHLLAEGLAGGLRPGDEIVLAESAHESNFGPWARLERTGAKIRSWKVDPRSGAQDLEALDPLLGPRTRIVALPHVSNLLGEILPLEEIVRRAHAVGARVVADGVAYAPHRAMDVATWGVDWYVYSAYKVFGPHVAALFGRAEAWAEVEGRNHFFVPERSFPAKFELGGVCHEACAGLLALGPYLAFLAGREGARFDRSVVEDAFEHATALELPLQERLLAFLREKPKVRILGPAHGGPARVGTVSFVHAERRSAQIVAAVQRAGIGIRHGHMYAHRLCTALGLDPEDGVVRISLVHYNSPDEIERTIRALDPVL